MIHITKEQEPLYQEVNKGLFQLKETEKEMRQAAEQAKIYDNSLNLLNRTIKKNELTIKQLEKLSGSRSIYVPLGRAYQIHHLSFLKKDKESTIKEFGEANAKLAESAKDMESKIKVFSDKANEKYRILREGTEKLTKK